MKPKPITIPNTVFTVTTASFGGCDVEARSAAYYDYTEALRHLAWEIRTGFQLKSSEIDASVTYVCNDDPVRGPADEGVGGIVSHLDPDGFPMVKRKRIRIPGHGEHRPKGKKIRKILRKWIPNFCKAKDIPVDDPKAIVACKDNVQAGSVYHLLYVISPYEESIRNVGAVKKNDAQARSEKSLGYTGLKHVEIQWGGDDCYSIVFNSQCASQLSPGNYAR
jgi:hypothetical protein